MTATISVPRGQLEAIYRTLGDILKTEPQRAQPDPVSPVSSSVQDDEGFAQFLLQLMHGKVQNPRLPNPGSLSEFHRLTGGDLDIAGRVIDAVARREMSLGTTIQSPISYGLAMLKKNPRQFSEEPPTPAPVRPVKPPPPVPPRPSLEDVQRVIGGESPL